MDQIDSKEVEDGDVVVYSDDGVVKHAGRVQDGMIVSKWGTAHLWWHRLYEVPLRYGSTVKFFKALASTDSELAFLHYAEEKLGTRFT